MISCNFCSSGNYKILENANNEYKVLKCQECRLVYVHPIPPKEKLKNHYDEDYYKDWIDTQRARRIRMWENRIRMINRLRQPGRLLDVGCAEGLFLNIAKKSGWDVEGTEISEFACKEAHRQIGKKIKNGEVWEAHFDSASFDVVTIWHVLEHVLDPIKTLKEARRLLKPGGHCIVAVPNVNDRMMQLAYRIAKGKQATLFSPDDKELHLYHFSAKTLEMALHSAEFRKIKIKPDYGIIDPKKKLVNIFAVIPFYFAGFHYYNCLEATALV